jgi:hypothetical protein
MSEDDLLGTVLDMASTLGIRTAHFRPAKTAQGWRTPVQGDGQGWPDLVLVGAKVLFRELKSARGVTSAEQKLWLASLTRAGQDAGVWQPADLRSGRILAELRAIRTHAEAVSRG